MTKPRYKISPKNPNAIISVCIMLLSAIVRAVYFWGKELDALTFWVHFANVIAASLLFALLVLFFGEKRAEPTVIPLTMGVGFFMVKAFTFESLFHTVFCLTLYTAVLVLFSLTVFGIIPTKKLLYPLFGVPFLYHLFVEDMMLYVFADPQPSFFEWLPEISVLLIMAGLFFLSLSLERRN